MKVFVYEWATGGGLVEESGPMPASLAREGTAMIAGLVTDLQRIAGCQVVAFRDPRYVQLALGNCEIVEILSRFSHDEEVERVAAEADATVLIAPEFDGILLKLARRVVTARGKLLSPSPEFIRIAADKQRTCEVLRDAGVPVPEGRVLESDEPLPSAFSYPAVVKPIDGAGSQDTYIVRSAHDVPPAYAWQRRLERFVPGMAASVGTLCGPAGITCLMPCKQRLSEDGRLRYWGGELPLAAGLAERAESLAVKSIRALPATVGYVGVDLVLGREPDGSEDCVIEVNPRLTTSYVGLRAAARSNLAEAMLGIARGESRSIEYGDRSIEFDAAGNVSYMR
jgi:predicted ATP-grasp superfamily ATP-dependent carboligase